MELYGQFPRIIKRHARQFNIVAISANMKDFSKFGVGLQAKLTLELHSNFAAEISCSAISILYRKRSLFIDVQDNEGDFFSFQLRCIILPENIVQKALKLIYKILFGEEFPEGDIHDPWPGDGL